MLRRRVIAKASGTNMRMMTTFVGRGWSIILLGLSAASCAAHMNNISVADRLTTPLDAGCVQEVIRAFPGNQPSLGSAQWQTDVRMSDDSYTSSYAFTLPDIEGMRGPTGDALYWLHTSNVSELFSPQRYGLLFTSVVWTEAYPQSEARAVRLEDSVAAVRQHVLERCGGALIVPPECDRRYENGLTILSRKCLMEVRPN